MLSSVPDQQEFTARSAIHTHHGSTPESDIENFRQSFPMIYIVAIDPGRWEQAERGLLELGARAHWGKMYYTEPEMPDAFEAIPGYGIRATIDGYQVDLKANKCMACHSRRLTEESQAPMISVTHYMDRDANFLAEISPRRYFCEQCHVVQTNARPLLGNDFVDIDTMLHKDRGSAH